MLAGMHSVCKLSVTVPAVSPDTCSAPCPQASLCSSLASLVGRPMHQQQQQQQQHPQEQETVTQLVRSGRDGAALLAFTTASSDNGVAVSSPPKDLGMSMSDACLVEAGTAMSAVAHHSEKLTSASDPGCRAEAVGNKEACQVCLYVRIIVSVMTAVHSCSMSCVTSGSCCSGLALPVCCLQCCLHGSCGRTQHTDCLYFWC